MFFRKQKKEEIEKAEIFEGIRTRKDFISPSYINITNPKYLEIDNIFYAGIMITNYYREYTELILKNLLDINSNMQISIFYEKQDTYKTIKDITYHIGNTGVDLERKNKNSQDIDMIAFSHDDAKYIRREMQVNNENMYFLYIYICLFSENTKELEYLVNKMEGILNSNGMQTRRANFRQEQVFLSCLPMMINHEDIKNVSKRNVLTNGLLATYPFLSSSIFDENGIFIGSNIYNQSLVFVDRYQTDKYKNANMCILGTSGSRKIFFC